MRRPEIGDKLVCIDDADLDTTLTITGEDPKRGGIYVVRGSFIGEQIKPSGDVDVGVLLDGIICKPSPIGREWAFSMRRFWTLAEFKELAAKVREYQLTAE